MHLLPWKILQKSLGVTDLSENDPAFVSVPRPVLKLLLEAAIKQQEFDEKTYLEGNPDVAVAVRKGLTAGAHEHYTKSGYFEGRDTSRVGFDEAYYVTKYPDVGEAVRRKDFPSAWHHYKAEGIYEWRSPNKAAEADLAIWRKALGRPPSEAPPEELPIRQRTRA
jgi:hypothetical protein